MLDTPRPTSTDQTSPTEGVRSDRSMVERLFSPEKMKNLSPLLSLVNARNLPFSGIIGVPGGRSRSSVEERGVRDVYRDLEVGMKEISKLPQRDQAKFLAGVYAQMQLDNPRMLFTGYASFVVKNIYSQIDNRFPRGSRDFATNRLLPGTFAVFKEITPALTAFSTALKRGWNLDRTLDAIKNQEGPRLDPYRAASLDYLRLNRKGLSARMTLMNEQYNTLQPMLYTSVFDRMMYRMAKMTGNLDQRVTISARPGEESGQLTVSPRTIDGNNVHFLSPEQRYNFGSAGLAVYKQLCRTDPEYVVSQLEHLRDEAQAVSPQLWTGVEQYFPKKPTDDSVRDFREAFARKSSKF